MWGKQAEAREKSLARNWHRWFPTWRGHERAALIYNNTWVQMIVAAVILANFFVNIVTFFFKLVCYCFNLALGFDQDLEPTVGVSYDLGGLVLSAGYDAADQGGKLGAKLSF